MIIIINANAFQKDLSHLINKICKEKGYSKVIEVGCESGITTMILNTDLEKYFFDLNKDILRKVELACGELEILGRYIHEDMFSMSCADATYDVVFNSGVIEHFSMAERIEILQEYSRVLKPDGRMIIAIPNHYSFPYRSAYLLKKKFLRGFQWPWPEECKIYDLKEELEEVGLDLVSRTTLAKGVIFDFWQFIKPIKYLFVRADLLLNYEGYLTTLVIKKRSD